VALGDGLGSMPDSAWLFALRFVANNNVEAGARDGAWVMAICAAASVTPGVLGEGWPSGAVGYVGPRACWLD